MTRIDGDGEPTQRRRGIGDPGWAPDSECELPILPEGEVAERRAIQIDRVPHPARFRRRADAVEVFVARLGHHGDDGRATDAVKQNGNSAVGFFDQIRWRWSSYRDLDVDPIGSR